MATHAGLLRLAADFATPAGVQCQILRQGAEETRLPTSSVDVAFTSPPYFNLELYADGEPSQSHVKYPTPSWWVEQFLQVRALCVLGLSRGVTLSLTRTLHPNPKPNPDHPHLHTSHLHPDPITEQRVFCNVFEALKPGGVFLLNVSNNRMLLDGRCDLERAACSCAQRAGFAEEPTLRMLKPRWTSAGATSAGRWEKARSAACARCVVGNQTGSVER